MGGSSPLLEISGAIASVTLRRPEQANRLEHGDLDCLLECFARIDADPDVRVVLLRSSGRYFCAGYNFGDLQSGSDGKAFERVAEALDDLRPLTIAEVQGGAYGGATDLLLACDFRIGAPETEMFIPAASLGLHLYGGLLERYVSRLGLNAAKRLILAAERLNARQMHECGLLTHLCTEAEDLPQAVQGLAERLAGMAPLAVSGMKRHLNCIARGTLDKEVLQADIQRCARSMDLAEGLRALQEKRPPNFTGK